MEEKALVKTQAEIDLRPPIEVVKLATEQANALMDIVEKKELYVEIEGKKFLEAEAWETIGAFNRTHAVTEWVRPIEQNDEVVAYEARVHLIKDGQLVGGAEMTCGLDEFPCRGKEGWAKHKAARSAAQTWATSKAYRMNFSYVAVLAGYAPTPAEEMQGGTADKHWCGIHDVPFIKRGKMKWWAHRIEGSDQWCSEEKVKKQEQGVVVVSDQPGESHIETKPQSNFDTAWLTDSLTKVHWKDATVKSYLKNVYQVETEGSVVDVVVRLTEEQRGMFFNEIKDRLQMV